jgi:hypothetical protein
MITRFAHLLAVTFMSASAATAQFLPESFGPELPVEKYDDPPVPLLLRNNGVSPAAVVPFGRFTSYQVNVNAAQQNITGDAANEPSIAVDPNNSNRIAIGWRQFDNVTSNFRQAGWGYSTNGGQNWAFPGSLESGVFRSDPVLLNHPDGSFFYNSLLSGFFTDQWRSLNGGQTWARLGPSTGGDKQWLILDPTNSSGRGFQYQAWSTAGNNYGGRQFSRSTDGGFTWIDPVFIPNSPRWGTLDVDSDGNLFISGANASTGQVYAVRSSNAKNGAVVPTFDQSVPVDIGGRLVASQPINPAGLVGQLWIAVDRSGGSRNNHIYMLASVRPTGVTTGSEVMIVRSTNGGQSFGAPRRVNDDPVNPAKWHWFGALSVAPNGRLDVTWLDTRNAANNTDSQLYYSYSFDGGLNWAPNIPASPSFNPFLGYPNQNKMGDYTHMVSDNSGAHLAYCATFNGEQDVYYVKVTPQPPVPQSAVSRKTHGTAGAFDLPLALTGSPTVESRRGGGTNSGEHQIVVTFGSPVTATGVTVTGAPGASATQTVSGNVVTVNLTNVPDAQVVQVQLNNVSDGTNFGPVTIPMAVLLGDSTGDGAVNAGDALQTRGRSGAVTDAANYRSDVNTDGNVNSGDVIVVRGRAGASLP